MDRPIYRDEAIVTLTSIDPLPSMSFPKRKMLLCRSKNTMLIGRTSKRNAQYEAMEKNCWIDSAVMSREHAQLRLDPQQQTIILRDSGSLHGTFANNKRLGRNQEHIVQNGDVIRFGIPIEHGHETYRPCTFAAHVEFGLLSPTERPTVFAVPDETDIDDLSGDDNDDAGVEHSSQILRSNSIYPALPDARPEEQQDQVIDLTTNDDVKQDSQLIDQRSSPEFEQHPVRSELSESRMPTPPETLEIFEEDPMYTESDVGEDESIASHVDSHHDTESRAASADGSVNGDPMLTAAMSFQRGVNTTVDEPSPQIMPQENEVDAESKRDHLPIDLLGMERDAPVAPETKDLAADEPMDEQMDAGLNEDISFYQSFVDSSGGPLDDTSAYQWGMNQRMEAKRAELLQLQNGLVDVENSLDSYSLSESPALVRRNKRKAREISREDNVEDDAESLSGNQQYDVPSPKRFRNVAEAAVLVAAGAAIGGVAIVSTLIATAPNF